MRSAEVRVGVLVIATVLALALCGWGLRHLMATRWPGVPKPAPTSTAAKTSTGDSGVDLVDAASAALQDCARAVPPSVPDGASATREQMTAARGAFQAYDKATDAYVHCVDQAIERIASQYAAVASPAELKSLKAFGVGAHDTAIDQEQAVADQFNTQVRAYRAKHPQS